jgi:hypothetical protein
MFSIQKFFSRDAKFFDLLEASADETRALTQLLIDLLKNPSHNRLREGDSPQFCSADSAKMGTVPGGFVRGSKDRSHARPLHEFALARGKDKRITEQISEELVNTFVIGPEREDIEILSYAMYRICKSIEKFAERFNLAPQRLAVVDFTRQIDLMQRATETLSQMVRSTSCSVFSSWGSCMPCCATGSRARSTWSSARPRWSTPPAWA